MITWNTDAAQPPTDAQAAKAAQERVLWAVRDALRAAGPAGLTTGELYAICPSAVRRLNDLRHQHGYDYTRTYERPTWRYVLIEPEAAAPARAARAQVTDRLVSEAARILARARRRPALPSSVPSLF